MPVRPRHCNGHDAPLTTPLTPVGKASAGGPEPGDDSRPRHIDSPSGGGLVASSVRRALGRSRAPIPRGRVPVVFLRTPLWVLSLIVVACSSDVASGRADASGAPMPPDDFGDTIAAVDAPARIVSLNPATTELIFALGAGNRLVGRTQYDEWPAAALAVPDVGSGLRPNIERVLATRPDLVVLYASSDNRAAAVRLREAGVETLSLKVDRIEHFERAAHLLGRILGDTVRSRLVVDTVRATLDSVRASTATRPRLRVVWPVDVAPLIVIGGGSFLSQLIDIAGGVNVYGDQPAVSPQLSLEDVHRLDPDVILANPRLAARIRSDPAWMGLRAIREGRLLEADEVLMGRQSVRMGEAAAALATILRTGASRPR
jgi:iron complex transport system substrate-binding protein